MDHQKNITTPLVGAAGIPALGFGTWQLEDKEGIEGVATALNLGYEHIDTAQAYHNEKQVAQGIKESGVSREKFFLTTKIFPEDGHFKPDQFLEQAKISRDRLDTAPDLLLLHWPDPEVELEKTLEAAQKARQMGLTKHIGVSNFTIDYLERALKVEPEIVCNQVEYHPFIDQSKLEHFMQEHKIALTAYSPLARGDAFDSDVLKQIAEDTGASVSQVTLAWIMARGHICIPKATSKEHIADNLKSRDLKLSADQLDQISAMRSSKGRKIDPDFAPEWDDSAA